jgi:phenylacetic acid degradation operon negative regulatory protein
MKAKTEELMWMLLWTGEMLMRPTFRNLTDSFEHWAYRNGFARQLQRLERSGMVESKPGESGDRLHRLSEAGVAAALGGEDPTLRWERRWDGQWRLVLFDVPESRSGERNRIRGYLQQRGFGYLQNSVWISPDPVADERKLLADGPVDATSLVLLEARPCAGESDADLVKAGWDFEVINRNYVRHQEKLDRFPRAGADPGAAAVALCRWMREERAAWQAAAAADPFLPRELWPAGYPGRDSWERRKALMLEAGEHMRSFKAGKLR